MKNFKHDIYLIPDGIGRFDYLKFLYGNTEGKAENGSIFVIKKFSWKELLIGSFKRTEKHIIHIHWETNIYGSKYIMMSIIRMISRLFGLFLLKLMGTKIVWTKHNMRAHDYPHPLIDDMGRFFIWKIVDVVILHERTFAETESKHRKYSNIVCIPPGNYINAYGPLWHGDRDALRRSFGISPDKIIIMAIGSIRPYKALPKLIEVFKKSRIRNDKLHLLIVGKSDPVYVEVIRRKIENDPSITLHSSFIPNEKLPKYLALADYTICYYGESALGSAAIMLSLSYGTPVISRDFPASELIVQGVGGYIFHDGSELENLLTNLVSVNDIDRNAVINTVKNQDWETAGYKLRKVYENL